MQPLEKIGELAIQAGKYVIASPDLVNRVLDLAISIFKAKDPGEAARVAQEALMKESYRHGFTPTPDRKPVP